MILCFVIGALFLLFLFPVADLEGVHGVGSNPPLEPNYFVLMGNLKKF